MQRRGASVDRQAKRPPPSPKVTRTDDSVVRVLEDEVVGLRNNVVGRAIPLTG